MLSHFLSPLTNVVLLSRISLDPKISNKNNQKIINKVAFCFFYLIVHGILCWKVFAILCQHFWENNMPLIPMVSYKLRFSTEQSKRDRVKTKISSVNILHCWFCGKSIVKDLPEILYIQSYIGLIERVFDKKKNLMNNLPLDLRSQYSLKRVNKLLSQKQFEFGNKQ